MNPDGSGLTQVTFSNSPTMANSDWQSIPINAYARPKSATPIYAPLVPAFVPCGTPNRVHAAPLSYSSCAPPQQTSGYATVGSPDANGLIAQSSGSVRMTVVPADVNLSITITDVRQQGTLDDYVGELRLQRRRARNRQAEPPAPTPSGLGAATVQDVGFGPTVPCTPTGGSVVGSTCSCRPRSTR